MNNIDVEQLKATTKRVIEETEEREAKRLLLCSEAFYTESKKYTDVLSANCEEAAKNGKYRVLVMEDVDYEIALAGNNHLKYTALKGASRIVWNMCIDQKLNPELVHWHDGGGQKGGFKMWVDWEDKPVKRGTIR